MKAWPGTLLTGSDNASIEVLDQNLLPHREKWLSLRSLFDVCQAITDMTVRGAGLIGNTAAYGMWLAAYENRHLAMPVFIKAMHDSANKLKNTRPTAKNLAWAIDHMLLELEINKTSSAAEAVNLFRILADRLAKSEALACRRIGELGKELIEDMATRKAGPINILTHCNAGKLAFIDYGSALAPIYAAHEAGISLHVFVDETRPRNQGAYLTAWELMRHEIPHTLITDNAGGHLMQHGLVDMVIVGADRVSRCGDVANKIGTYLKALAACDNNVPFYVALPCSTFDLSLANGVFDIPIEERDADEVRHVSGLLDNGTFGRVQICAGNTPAANFAFDVTPARLISGFICERGICQAEEQAIMGLLAGV